MTLLELQIVNFCPCMARAMRCGEVRRTYADTVEAVCGEWDEDIEEGKPVISGRVEWAQTCCGEELNSDVLFFVCSIVP